MRCNSQGLLAFAMSVKSFGPSGTCSSFGETSGDTLTYPLYNEIQSFSKYSPSFPLFAGDHLRGLVKWLSSPGSSCFLDARPVTYFRAHASHSTRNVDSGGNDCGSPFATCTPFLIRTDFNVCRKVALSRSIMCGIPFTAVKLRLC